MIIGFVVGNRWRSHRLTAFISWRRWLHLQGPTRGFRPQQRPLGIGPGCLLCWLRFAKCPRSERKSRLPKAEEVFRLRHGCLEQRVVDCRFGPSKALVLLCRHSATKALSASLVEKEPWSWGKCEGNAGKSQVQLQPQVLQLKSRLQPNNTKRCRSTPLVDF